MQYPETVGLVGLIIALVIAWVKIRPAMRKIEVDEDASLRSDLLGRITHLEDSINGERNSHHSIILEIRQEHDRTIKDMQARHDIICRDYEEKLRQFQERVDRLMTQLLERKV